MKKFIVAALSVILGTFGYTVVDQAIENRVANLEAQVSIQQSVIDGMEFASGFKLAHDMDVGEEMLCIPSEPTVYTLDNGTEVTIDSFKSTVYQHRTTGELCDDAGLTEFAETLFKYEISGKTDPRYAYRTIGFTIDTTYKQFSFWAQINSDGSFRTEYIRPFIQEFASEIRHIYIHDYDLDATTAFPFTTKATTTTLPAEGTTKFPTTTKIPATTTTYPYHTTTYPYLTTTSVSYENVIDSGWCGDYAQWELTSDGTLTIWGKGDMYNSVPKWKSYKNSIKKVIIKEGVTSIGESAFSGCENIASVKIPNGVTRIETYAFSNCKSLTSVDIPDSVTSIGQNAFYNCKSMKNVDIPNSVVFIGSYAFAYCESFTTINIPCKITEIDSGVFTGCTNLTSVNIPDSVTTIYGSAFSSCTSLTSVNIPDSVTSIYRSAFYNCSSLQTVTIGKGLKSVLDMAFAGCENLTDVYYAGTETEWSKISISTNNARLTDANIHYNYTA